MRQENEATNSIDPTRSRRAHVLFINLAWSWLFQNAHRSYPIEPIEGNANRIKNDRIQSNPTQPNPIGDTLYDTSRRRQNKTAYGSAHGVWHMAHGSWLMVHGVWCMEYGVWHGARSFLGKRNISTSYSAPIRMYIQHTYAMPTNTWSNQT